MGELNKRYLSTGLALLLLSGCGGTSGSEQADAQTGVDAGSLGDADSPDANAPDAGPHTVTVTMNRIFNTPTGDVTVAYSVAEMAEIGFGILLPPNFDSELMPSTEADGVVTFANVPSGTVYIRRGTTFVASDRDTVDFSHFQLGREDTTEALLATDIVLNVSGMDAWQDGDELQLYSAGSGTYNSGMQTGVSAGVPLVNDTALSGFTYNITQSTYAPYLIDGDAGDQAILSHLSTSTDGIHSYLALKETFEPAYFVMSDGGSTAVTGAFTDVAQDKNLSLRWDRAAFDSAMHDQVPGAAQAYPIMTAHVLPGADTRGSYYSSTDTLIFAPGYTTDISEVQANWAYGDPHPADWTRLLTTQYYTYRFVAVPPATARPVYSYLETQVELSTVPSNGLIQPLVGPVTRFQIAGQDAYGTLNAIGQSPTVSWDPPALGQADVYVVFVERAYNDGGATAVEFVRSITTEDTSVVVAGLQPGESYVIGVRTLSDTGVDRIATPFQSSFPAGSASAVSSLATP